jgi:hypothetical protein
VGFAAGVVLFVVTMVSVVGTLVVPRSVDFRISRTSEALVDAMFRLATRGAQSYQTRDKVLAWQAPVALLFRLTLWLALSGGAFALMLLPAVHGSMGRAFIDSGSSMFTLGFAVPQGTGGTAITYCAALTGLIVVGLQVGYLPTLYAAFNRRETEVSLLMARAGIPAWGPEILARTRWGIYDGDARPVLDELFTAWERWSAEVAESHTTYLTLARLRSARPWSHWLTSLVAVMDAAAIHLSLAPSIEPKLSARMCLRMGFVALDQIARTMRLPVPDNPDPESAICVEFNQFEAAVAMLRELGYPMERTAEEAWPHFRGWRVNYDVAALALARAVDAPPSLWSGPRRWPSVPTPPERPATLPLPSAVRSAERAS